MKNILLLMILVSSSQFVSSQSNLELGTKWTFSQYLIGGPIEPTYIEIVSDTVINGTMWYLIQGEGGCAFNSNSKPLIREDSLKWYTYNLNEQTESILYDFDLNSNDSYFVEYFGSSFPIEVRIDSTSTELFNGIERKVQYCSNPNSNNDGFFFGGQIIEGIGSTGYLFPQGNICDPHAGPLRCYQNNSEFIDFDEDRDCDDSYFSTNTSETQLNLNIKVYPNPVFISQSIQIESEQIVERITIIDAKGAILRTNSPKSKEAIIEVNKEGIYYIKIESLNKVGFRKLIIMGE